MSFGTKKIWKAIPGVSQSQKDNQIVRNAGYINIQLQSVNYNPDKPFFQRVFGERDCCVALTSCLTFKTPTSVVEANYVHDVCDIEPGCTCNVEFQRNIAVQIPACTETVEFGVRMTAISDYTLQSKFDMLNTPLYQKPLSLAPFTLGQTWVVNSIVKELCNEAVSESQVETRCIWTISPEVVEAPVNSDCLTQGLCILVATSDNRFDAIDNSQFELRENVLYCQGTPVDNCYVVFRVTTEKLKGVDETSVWCKKYNEAITCLDKIKTVPSCDPERIFAECTQIWVEGNALIENDPNYLAYERINISNAVRDAIRNKYQTLTGKSLTPVMYKETLRNLVGTVTFGTIERALPVTGGFLRNELKIDTNKPIDTTMFTKIESTFDGKIIDLLNQDTERYLTDLKNEHITFKLG